MTQRKNNSISMADRFQLFQVLEKMPEDLSLKSDSECAAIAEQKLNFKFKITSSNVCSVRKALGIEKVFGKVVENLKPKSNDQLNRIEEKLDKLLSFYK